MVDAAALFAGNAATSRGLHAAGAFSADATASLEDYVAFCSGAAFAPPQNPAWISAWIAEATPDALFATLKRDGTRAMMLALEVVRLRGCRVARFMAGRHANGNFPACAENLPELDAAALATLMEAIRAARPDIDLIALERLAPELNGKENPLSTLPGFASPNIALSVDLTGGFDAVLGRTSAKRKRKKYRSQLRKFETLGGVRRVEAASREETDRLLDAFFEMKRVRFQKAGLRDVFAEAEVQAFFRRLFADAAGASRPGFVLHGLEVAGKLRAVTGSSLIDGRITCEFGAIAEDDVAYTSPGDFLFFENIREACDQGLATYDFGVGDEPYKRLWCDIETRHRDVLMAVSAKGRVLAYAMRAFAGLKAWVKGSPLVWGMVRRFRRQTAGSASPGELDGDGNPGN